MCGKGEKRLSEPHYSEIVLVATSIPIFWSVYIDVYCLYHKRW